LNTHTTNDELNINHKPLNTNQETLTNNQLKEKTTPVKLDYSVLHMSIEQCSDVIRIRKKNKGTALTQRIINSLADEFKKGWDLGLNVDDMITEWEVRGWKSFKAEWMKSNSTAPQQRPVSTTEFFK
jgi:capsular polysaccharide biosynthesis protein